jgi:hypothetical protein
MTELIGRDLYMRRTTADGKRVVTQHRVWDADRFVAAQRAEAQRQAEKDNCKPDQIAVVGPQEYRGRRRN